MKSWHFVMLRFRTLTIIKIHSKSQMSMFYTDRVLLIAIKYIYHRKTRLLICYLQQTVNGSLIFFQAKLNVFAVVNPITVHNLNCDTVGRVSD